jgi:putative oxidoreductase
MLNGRRPKGELVMRNVSAIARYLAGVIFLVFGLNGFLNFIPLPPPGGIAGVFMGALYASHYLWVIFAFQVIAGVLLLINRYVPLAVAVLAPVIVNILTFHALMAPSGLPLAAFVAILWGIIFIDVRPAFAGLFQSHVERSSKRSRDLTRVPVRAN